MLRVSSMAVFAILPSLRFTHANLISHEENIQRPHSGALLRGPTDTASRSINDFLPAAAISDVGSVIPTASHIESSAELTELLDVSPTFPPSVIPSASTSPSAMPIIPAALTPSIAPTLALASYPSASPLAPTTPLTGYFVVAQYSDAACSSVLYSESKKLNYCTYNSDKTYSVYTATASNFVGTKYSDAACSAALGSTTLSYSDVCNGKVRAFVSDTGIPQSSTFIQSYRFVIIFCLAVS